MSKRTQWLALAAFAGLAGACLLASLLAGSADLSIGRALAALRGGGDELAGTIVRTIRLPRTISAFAVGSLLGLAGVLLQALFRNPLADPFVLGVSGGASVGALAGMLAGVSLGGLEWTATGGALCVGALVLWLGTGGDPGRLLLSGVVLASACGAIISVLLAIADNGQLRGMVFWLAGDLGWAQHPWFDLAAAAAALLLSLIGGRALNVLAAGELRSAVLGLDARLARPLVFLVAAALTSLAVLAAGPVGFVGLVAPHLVRLALRTSDHRLVAPGAALCGGALLCLADIASRTIAAPRQLPVGAITALVGAPVFLLLLRRRALR
ncbi:MAG TPA: iron ABC transporter permease [Steroidobacteraceae bacterium]|nr:iron ABC transporter permease [Steroidobacteraceae bacterium]